MVWRAVEHGIAPADMSTILSELEEAGALRPATTPPDDVPTIRVHGRGPLADAISSALTTGPARVTRSTHFTADTDVTTWNCLCVVLTDELVVDPRLVDALLVAGIPHLPVRLRDGRGVVGPLVLPGSTSCLRCADLTRSDADEEWPHVAAQLLGRVGHAAPATVLATTAVAFGTAGNGASRGRPAPRPRAWTRRSRSTSIRTRFAVRPWPRDPRCGCSVPQSSWTNPRIFRHDGLVSDIPRRSTARTAKLASIPLASPVARRWVSGASWPVGTGTRSTPADREGRRAVVHRAG